MSTESGNLLLGAALIAPAWGTLAGVSAAKTAASPAHSTRLIA